MLRDDEHPGFAGVAFLEHGDGTRSLIAAALADKVFAGRAAVWCVGAAKDPDPAADEVMLDWQIDLTRWRMTPLVELPFTEVDLVVLLGHEVVCPKALAHAGSLRWELPEDVTDRVEMLRGVRDAVARHVTWLDTGNYALARRRDELHDLLEAAFDVAVIETSPRGYCAPSLGAPFVDAPNLPPHDGLHRASYVETGVCVRLRLDHPAVPSDAASALRARHPTRLTAGGDLVAYDRSSRSQHQNRLVATTQLLDWVLEAGSPRG